MNPESFDEMLTAQDRHWWFRSRRAFIENYLRSLRLPPDTRILEIGAGVGGNLEMLSQFGPVTAVESSEYAVRLMRQRFEGCARILKGSLPEEMPDDGPYDLIGMFDVLEHIDREHDSLLTLRRLMAPKGRLLLAVPAYQWLWSRHDDVLMHRRRYTVARLTGALRSAGFSVSYTTYFFASVLPLAMVMRLLDRFRTGEHDTGSGVPPKPINEALYGLSQLERRVMGRVPTPFGLSILAEAWINDRIEARSV